MAALFCARTLPATLIQYDIGSVFSAAIFGSTPAATPPWLTAKLDDGGSTGSVTLELIVANALDSAAFVSEWDFNLDPNLDPTSLVFTGPTQVGSFDVDPVGKGIDAFQADGDGKYDISFTFGTSNAGGGIHRFAAGEKATYTITGIASLTANSFDFLSAPGGGAGPFFTAAHIQGVTAPDGTTITSVWSTIPEPSAVVLLLMAGLIGAGWRGRSRLRRSRPTEE